jgi:tRNA(His) guanylyltransferase
VHFVRIIGNRLFVPQGTVSADKNEILFAQFQINYNNLPQLFRKGSVLYRKRVEEEITAKDGKPSVRLRWRVVCEHRDIIGDEFWRDNPHLLEA